MYSNVAGYMTLYLLGCFKRHKVLIHFSRNNRNFGELTPLSIL